MMREPRAVIPHKLLDTVKEKYNVKSDAALSRALGVAPPVLSKIRSDDLPVGPNMILRIHEAFDMPVKEIRAALEN